VGWMKRGSTRWAGHPSPSRSFMLVTLLRKLGCARFGESSRWVEAHPCGESSIDRHRALVFFPSPPWPRCMRRRELALLSLVGAWRAGVVPRGFSSVGTWLCDFSGMS